MSEPPQFRLNTEGRDPAEISLAQREEIGSVLERLFGTTDQPEVPDGVDLQPDLLQMAAGPIRSDAQGNQRGLYRQHCAACHGISGDGAGPVAAVLDPYPRDFRWGRFKYTSTAGGAKPVREDLSLALSVGNADTAMPSFSLLPERELDALVEYVEYLSIRGETELYLFELVVGEDVYPVRIKEVIKDSLLRTVELWAEAPQTAVVPPDPPPIDPPQRLAELIAAGRGLYVGQDAKCFQCHGPSGEGDGEQSELYDDWNDPKRKKDAAWFLLPIQRVRPRNFTQGTFRGGPRPIDVYWRIHVGIKGTPMPPAGPAPGSTGVLTPEEIWEVVNYVRSLGPEGGRR